MPYLPDTMPLTLALADALAPEGEIPEKVLMAPPADFNAPISGLGPQPLERCWKSGSRALWFTSTPQVEQMIWYEDGHSIGGDNHPTVGLLWNRLSWMRCPTVGVVTPTSVK